MANALGFDFGKVQSNVESIKTARVNRNYLNTQHEAARYGLDRRRKTDAASDATAGQNALNRKTVEDLRRRAAGGDETALTELAVLDPKAATQFADTLAGLDERGQEQVRANIEFMGRSASFILNSGNPAAAYAEVRGSVPQEIQAGMPEQYDKNWVRFQLAQATDMDKLADRHLGQQEANAQTGRDIATEDRAEGRTIATEDRKAERDADAATLAHERALESTIKSEELRRETATAKAEAEAKVKEGGLREVKASDSNTIYRQAAAFFDGIEVPDGQGGHTFRLTDPTHADRLQALASLASSIWSADKTKTHAEAVEEAARRLNIIAVGGDGDDDDPLGLRGG